MLRLLAALALAALTTSCAGAESEPEAAPASRDSSPGVSFPSPEPRTTLSTGEVHGIPYTVTYGRVGGGKCLTLVLEASPPKEREVCNLARTSIDAFGFAKLPDSTNGVLFGVVPTDLSAGAAYQFEDVLLNGEAKPPLDKTHGVSAYVLPTTPAVYGKRFVYAALTKDGGLLGPFPYRVPALTEEQVRELTPVQ